ncbi:stage V sporulation protein AE [Fuchsiella alkaliacetigena]|uniref:stage V sporulation protein AE n=1 Tax=Fuchsiella alkaliacetigena TaxID=957042 RepID=UPI00200B2815|nr:stage V sporulation protein AE [Fuchsiella alkaliacetigena]MCK8825170.1 stage V sporulation protein AE [Fuchsiella alkaliacetigena]
MAAQKAILITDGDRTAQNTIETVADKLNLRTISSSAGNPTPCSGEKIIELIKASPAEVVLVMFDDEGDLQQGAGEKALERVLASSEIEVLGVVAVAANSKEVQGIEPDFSITREGERVAEPVDKEGQVEAEGNIYLEGDTVDVINQFEVPLVVGVGDIGKMDEQDRLEAGAPITTQAIEEILARSGIDYEAYS